MFIESEPLPGRTHPYKPARGDTGGQHNSDVTDVRFDSALSTCADTVLLVLLSRFLEYLVFRLTQHRLLYII